ncbi:hypothetical protein [Shewanella benthica]|uniref:ResB-like domain-containing protein n=1 Tax=Shewanella benthica KT99 TaxID=314608 RepID=A9DCT7_9GAMM|nr:hypothetical protein [Shewanella benthica]EDQ00267.1 hypothetical protein KT99_07568 [Shewanella benthica KT99]
MKMNWLYSMRLAFVLLVALTLWFAIGVAMSEYDAPRQALRSLDNLPMSQWLQSLSATPTVGFWMLGLFILMFLLSLNTALCSWRDLLPTWRRRRWRSPRIMMLPIHVLTLLIFMCHGVDLVFIHGHDSAVLHRGEHFTSGRYQIELVKVDYRDDIAMITENKEGLSPAGRITRRSIEQFDPRHNSAQFIIRDGPLQMSGDAGFMRQLRWNDLYITVTDFTVPYKEQNLGVQVKVLAVHNPLVNYFFACYGLLLVSLLLQGLIFWRRSIKNGGRR